MAFVDDLVLLSDSWEGMATNTTILELTELKVQSSKCCGFLVEKIAGKPLSINTRNLWMLCGEAVCWILAIGKAPLSPMEKVLLLNSYAILRVIFSADNCMASAKT